jgi:hypothetical protein
MLVEPLRDQRFRSGRWAGRAKHHAIDTAFSALNTRVILSCPARVHVA